MIHGTMNVEDNRFVWEQKPVLRAIYADYYALIRSFTVEGKTLEIGAGPGNMKKVGNDVVSTDIVFAPWLDASCDAQVLPFSNASFANIVMVDVLHHIARPALFLAEAQRVLDTGGRLIMIEPGITPFSYFFYRWFHHEEVDSSCDPLDQSPAPSKDPFEGNQAVPTQLFLRGHQRIRSVAPKLKLKRKAWLSLFAYPLSGGFRSWTLLPARLVPLILSFERALLPILGPLCAFRLFVILEKHKVI